ncbi:MAG: VOC family protein [Candidatus Krumholzibacteria bacterium]|nr:VOC family protein [Candidatus Krumholzibacteria bacterium]
MSDQESMAPGSICWRDLTVRDAQAVSDFYQGVVGWQASAVQMSGYNDFSMVTAAGETVAGICHARGSNADLPPQWLVYIVVADVEKSAARCEELGGTVVAGPRAMGEGSLCVIRDPAGAVSALYQPSQ